MRLRNVKNAREILENSKYFIKDYKNYKGNFKKIFNNDNEIRIEIGMGKGTFITTLAKENPNINFIGVEKYESVLVRGIQKANEMDLPNLRMICCDAKELNEVFDHEINTIYLNFSDPWPKDRHAKRRLTSPLFLDIYNKIFMGRNRIVMKTDNINLFNYSLESLVNYGYEIIDKTNNVDCEKDDNIMTEYEKKFHNLGININKLEAIKK